MLNVAFLLRIQVIFHSSIVAIPSTDHGKERHVWASLDITGHTHLAILVLHAIVY